MNADLKGMKKYYAHKNMSNILKSDSGRYLTDREARSFIDYCLKKGYTKLYECPEFEDIKDML